MFVTAGAITEVQGLLVPILSGMKRGTKGTRVEGTKLMEVVRTKWSVVVSVLTSTKLSSSFQPSYGAAVGSALSIVPFA